MRIIARFTTLGYWKSHTVERLVRHIFDFVFFVKDIVREYFIIRKLGLKITKLTVEKR